MEGIVHRTVEVNGIRMHVAEKGEGPVVVLLHGFPELWYSWRHQIIGLADKGYRAVAPDLRGYGDSEAPPSVTDYTIFHLVGDIVALIDSLGQDKVQTDKVKALVNLSVAFRPWLSNVKPVDYFRSVYGDDYYVCRFQEHGIIEAQFAEFGIKSLMKTFMTSRSPSAIMIPREGGMGSPNDQISLPSWVSEEDIDYFASKLEQTGLTNPINYYRNLNLNCELTAPWSGAQMKVPTKFILGDLDLTYHYPGIQDYLHKSGFKEDVPLLGEVVVMPGVGHWINQEKPQEITEHIHDFINKF